MNIIAQAASNLRGHWHQGEFWGPEDTACGLGHLNNLCVGMLGNEEYIVAKDLMDAVALEQYPERYNPENTDCTHFASFNDHPDTTEDEVVAVMEKAAVRLDEQV